MSQLRMLSQIHAPLIVHQEEPKWIFMRPSKTAGSSIREVLTKRFPNAFSGKSDPDQYAEWLSHDIKLGEYYRFSVCRNPFSRIVSASTYFRANTVRDFIDSLTDSPQRSAHVVPCHCYAFCGTEPFVDDILRFEQIDKDIHRVFEVLGISGPLPHINRTRHGHWNRHLAATDKEWVQRHYARDFKLFGYDPEK